MISKLRRLPLWLWYSVLFVIIVAVVYGSLFKAGKSLVWGVDGVTQHLPILIEFQKMLKGIGNQSLFSWSWNLGLGADQMTTFSYYVVGDPFNYLIKFFPVSRVEAGYQLLILLRLYVVGLGFLRFSSIWHFSRFSQLIGSLTYTLTAFTFFAGMHHPFFLLPMILFPLLCWGIERVFRGQNWWPLSLVVFLTVVSNIYFTYLLGIGCIIYTVWRYFQLVRQQRIQLKLSVVAWRLVASVIIGIFSAGVVLIPTLLIMMHSARTSAQFASGMILYPLSYYEKLPNLVLANGSGWPFWTILGMSGVTFFGIVHSLRHFKRNIYINVVLIAIFVGMLIPAVAAVFNVMTSPSNRWLLMTTLLFAFLTMRLVDDIDLLDNKDYCWFIISSVGLLILIWINGGFYLNISRHDAETYFILFLILVWIMGWRTLKLSRLTYISGLLMLVSLNLMNNGLGWMSDRQSTQNSGQLLRGAATNWTKHYLDGAEKSLPKNAGFYRTSLATGYATRTDTPGNNIPMVMGIHDMASYFSVQNSAVNNFSQSVGNQVAVVNSPLGNAAERTTIQNLLGVRYIFQRANKYNANNLPIGYHVLKNANGKPKVYHDIHVANGLSNGTGTVILVNKNALPLVYTQTSQVTSDVYRQLSNVEREQAMVQGAVTTHKIQGVSTSKLNKNVTTVGYKVKANTSKIINNTSKAIASRKKNKQSTVLNSKAKQVIKQNQTVVSEIKNSNHSGLKVIQNGAAGEVTTYKLILTHPEQYRNKELYLDLSGIDAQYSNLTGLNSASLSGTSISRKEKNEQALNSSVLKWAAVPNRYYLNATTHTSATVYTQQSIENLSNFVDRKHVLLNLGSSKESRKTITIRVNGVQQLHFKHVKVIAVDFNKQYQQQIKRLQKRQLSNLKVTNNTVTGTSNYRQDSILTTSIPYSTGWHLTVDGKKVATQTVNKGFVGAKISAGKHRIKLSYQTPGLRVGIIASIVGLATLIGCASFQMYRWPREKHDRN